MKTSAHLSSSLRTAVLWLLWIAAQQTCAAATLSVAPSVVGDNYVGFVTIQVSGLNPGETVTLQKYLDVNGNGALDGNDLLIQQFQWTDGRPGMVIGGVANSNVLGDTDNLAGQITAVWNFQSGDFMQTIDASYLYKLTRSVLGAQPLTAPFTVTNAPHGAVLTGSVLSNTTTAPAPNAVVFLAPPRSDAGGGPGGQPVIGVLTDSNGRYRLSAPVGTYVLLAVKPGWVTDFGSLPVVTLAAGATATNQLSMVPASTNISGSLVDLAAPSLTLPGVFVTAKSAEGLFAPGFTDSNGAFSIGVAAAGAWQISPDGSGLIAHGYLAPNNGVAATPGQTGVTVSAPRATALFYGSLKDPQGAPLVGVDVELQGDDNYYADAYTDPNGNYSLGTLAGGWGIDVNTASLPAPYARYIFPASPTLTLTNGEALQLSAAALQATNTISGFLKSAAGAGIPGVGVQGRATVGGVTYQTAVTYTGAEGDYSLAVGNGTWDVYVQTGGGSHSLPGNYIPPPDATVVILNDNAIANFTALTAASLISGRLTDDHGAPISGVYLSASATINGVSYWQESQPTDGNGAYSINVFNGDWSVVVEYGGSHGLPGGYLFPPNQNVTIANNNGTANFIAPAATRQVSGHLRDDRGNPIPGVQMWASGSIAGVDYWQGGISTDANGYYALNVADGVWSVGVNTGTGTGALPSNYLAPDSQNVTLSGAGATADFVALLAAYQISGHLTDDLGSPIPGVAVEATATIGGVTYFVGGQSGGAPTDAQGYYSMNVANGSWSVWVETGGSDILPPGYLSPPGQSVAITNHGATVDFIAPVAAQRITGIVHDSDGHALSGLGVQGDATINGVSYSQLVGTDNDGNYSLPVTRGNWNVQVLCSGAGYDNVSTLDDLLGSGNYACPASFEVTVAGTDVTANIKVQLCDGLQISTTSLPPAVAGAYYDTVLAAASCSQQITWSLNDPQDFPTSLNWSAAGEISGTPAAPGSYTFSVHAADGAGQAADRTLTLTIQAGSTPLQVVTSELPAATNGAPYQQTLQATGGSGGYTWAIPNYSAQPPAGLRLGTNGVLSGVLATNGGPFYFDVGVTDSSGATAYQTLSLLVVNPPPPALSITTTSLPEATVDAAYEQQLIATGGRPPYAWGLALGSAALPAGLSLSPQGVLSGAPTSQGGATFRVQVTDSASASTKQVLSLLVGPPPTLTALGWDGQHLRLLVTGVTGQTYSLQAAADLGARTWTTLLVTNNPATNAFVLTDPTPAGTQGAPRFYRVLATP